MGWEIWKGHQTVVLSKHKFFVEKAYQGVTGLCCQATAQMPARETAHIHLSATTAEQCGFKYLLQAARTASLIFIPKCKILAPENQRSIIKKTQMIISSKTDLVCKKSAKMTHNDDVLYFIPAGTVY